MKSLSQSLIKYTIWALIFMGSTYVYAVGTWSEPTGTAPNGNTDAPLNLGSTAQNKTGALGATQYCDSLGANCLSTTQIISTSSTSQTKSGFLWAGGFGSTAGGYFTDSVGISTTSTSAKLNVMKVVDSGPTSLGYGIESYIRPSGLSNWYSVSNLESTAAIKGTFDSTTRTNYTGSGVMGVTIGSNQAYGVLGITYSDVSGRVAVMGDATKSTYSGGIGVKGIGTGYGVYGVGGGSSGYGVYGENNGGTGVIGYVTAGTGWGVKGRGSGAGGAFLALAGGTGGNFVAASSKRWKLDITPISDSLDKIGKLSGVYFNWDEEHGGYHDMGLIAEEVGKVFPEVVSWEDNKKDAIGLDYGRLSAVLISGVNDLNKKNKVLETEIESLRMKNKTLEERITRLEALIK